MIVDIIYIILVSRFVVKGTYLYMIMYIFIPKLYNQIPFVSEFKKTFPTHILYVYGYLRSLALI